MTLPPVRRPGVVAVFGGTFDPPHWGHIRAAEAVRDRIGVEAVWLAPAGQPPHRPPPRLSACERLELVELAVAGRERLAASPVEVERAGPSFTLDTLDQLAAERPLPPDGGASLLLAVGADAFREIRSWRRYRELLERYPVLVHSRAGVSLTEALGVLPEPLRERVTEDLGSPLIPPRIFAMDIALPDHASHRIRERVRSRLPLGGQVPRRVAAEIGARGFYQ